MVKVKVKLLDVTLRDGGLGNNFSFSDTQIERIVAGLDRSGVDIIELGYFRPREYTQRVGPGVCHPQFLVDATSRGKRASHAVMVHTNEVACGDYASLRDTGVSWVRIPMTLQNHVFIEDHARAVASVGLRLSLNIIRITELTLTEIATLARHATRARASVLYVADSNGALYPARLTEIIRVIREESDLPLGLHPHDNMTLAFANALTALEAGFEYFDSSLGGFGKGGGNLATELIATYLNVAHGAQYEVFTLGELYEETILKWMPLKLFNRFVDNVSGLMNLNIDQLRKLKAHARESGLPIETLLRALVANQNRPDQPTLEISQ